MKALAPPQGHSRWDQPGAGGRDSHKGECRVGVSLRQKPRAWVGPGSPERGNRGCSVGHAGGTGLGSHSRVGSCLQLPPPPGTGSMGEGARCPRTRARARATPGPLPGPAASTRCPPAGASRWMGTVDGAGRADASAQKGPPARPCAHPPWRGAQTPGHAGLRSPTPAPRAGLQVGHASQVGTPTWQPHGESGDSGPSTAVPPRGPAAPAHASPVSCPL